MEVNISQTDERTRSYEFSQPVQSAKLTWLHESRYISGYSVEGKTLMVYATEGADWDKLESEFIVPGLKKTLGEVTINRKVHA